MSDFKCTVRLLTLAGILCCGSRASAQLGGGRIDRPIDRPAFSPYINMLRDNGSPGLNYFGLVRPQLESAQQNQQLEQNMQMIQGQQNQPMRAMNGGYGYSQLGVTGHPVVFNSFNQGQFGGGYTGMAGGGGGMAVGGMGGGINQMGGQQMMGAGGAGFGFSGVSGHAAQFGGIGHTSGMARDVRQCSAYSRPAATVSFRTKCDLNSE